MINRRIFSMIALPIALAPMRAFAYVVKVDTGVYTTLPKLSAGIINVLLLWSGVIATGLFLLGSVLMIGSGGSDQLLSAGKRIMKSALIGFSLVLLSWMIVSTVLFFLGAT